MALSTTELVAIVVVVVVVVVGTVVVCVFCWRALATISIEATKQGQSFGHTFRSSLRQGWRRLSGRGGRRQRQSEPSAEMEAQPNDSHPTVAVRTNSGKVQEKPPSYDEALNDKVITVRERDRYMQNGYHGVDPSIVNADLDVLTEGSSSRTRQVAASAARQNGSLEQDSRYFQPITPGEMLATPSFLLLGNNARSLLPNTVTAQAPATPRSPPYQERYIGDEADEGGFLKAQEHQAAKKPPTRVLQEAGVDVEQGESEQGTNSGRNSATNSDLLARRYGGHTYTQFLQTATKIFQHHHSRQNLDSSGDDDIDRALSTVSNVSSGYKTQDTHSYNGLGDGSGLEGYCNPVYRSDGHLNLSSLPRSESERSYYVTAVPRTEHAMRELSANETVLVFPQEDREHILSETYI